MIMGIFSWIAEKVIKKKEKEIEEKKVKEEEIKAMIGLVNIFINSKKEIFVVVSRKAKSGIFESISNLEGPIEISELYQCVETKLQYSLEMYHKDIEMVEFYKNGRYKTWNKFFKDNDLIMVQYNDQENLYRLAFMGKDLKYKAYGLHNENFDFKLSPEEFKNRFQKIMEDIIQYLSTK